MKKGWNRCPTQKKPKGCGRPSKGGLAWVCMVICMAMAMERSCSLWRRREFWDHSVPPKHNAFDSSLSLCGCDLTTSISSKGYARTSQWSRAHKQRTCPGNHPRSTPPEADVSPNGRHVLEDISNGWLQTALKERDVSAKKSHQRSQSTGCVLVRKAPTKPHSQASASASQSPR